jgi:hypothetical protein
LFFVCFFNSIFLSFFLFISSFNSLFFLSSLFSPPPTLPS